MKMWPTMQFVWVVAIFVALYQPTHTISTTDSYTISTTPVIVTESIESTTTVYDLANHSVTKSETFDSVSDKFTTLDSETASSLPPIVTYTFASPNSPKSNNEKIDSISLTTLATAEITAEPPSSTSKTLPPIVTYTFASPNSPKSNNEKIDSLNLTTLATAESTAEPTSKTSEKTLANAKDIKSTTIVSEIPTNDLPSVSDSVKDSTPVNNDLKDSTKRATESTIESTPTRDSITELTRTRNDTFDKPLIDSFKNYSPTNESHNNNTGSYNNGSTNKAADITLIILGCVAVGIMLLWMAAWAYSKYRLRGYTLPTEQSDIELGNSNTRRFSYNSKQD